ncbi:MAG: hypothetical protein WA708_07360 [Acidobacteriaceae bacterium]
MVSTCPFAWPSQASTPALHHRNAPDDDAGERADRSSSLQPSTLPNDVSGEYEFDHRNESIEIDIHRGRLSGYITRLGDAEADSSTPVTYFFDNTSLDGGHLEFQTHVVHGLWYSFRGTIVRGNGKVREDEGYYVLHGVFLEHHPQSGTYKSADETIARRIVNFKSMRRLEQ